MSLNVSKSLQKLVRFSPRATALARLFAFFCFAGYLLSIPYGATFLLSLLMSRHGGNEGDAGAVISLMMVSTLFSVLLAGHVTDWLGAAKSIATASLCLAAACLGFAIFPDALALMLLFGLLLGIGWGVFYTLGPIIIVMLIEPARRVHYFALLSGCMMSGIGSGPLIGRALAALGFPIETAFLIAAAAAIGGGGLFWALERPIGQAQVDSASICRIGVASLRLILQSKAIYPIVMVGLGGAIFGGLSSFQTSFALAHGLDYSLFFIGFMSAAIGCRLLIARIVAGWDPLLTSSILTGLIVLALLMFLGMVESRPLYLLAAVILGIGYGLTYSVINGLAAHQAPPGQMPQALLLFSLSYFIGVFGYPFLAGKLIVQFNLRAWLLVTLAIALINWGIALGRLILRR